MEIGNPLSQRFHQCISVGDPSQVGAARRALQAACERAGLDETQTGRAAIVASELAANIVRYTRGGELLFRYLDLPGGPAMEILGVDQGPGMADAEQCLVDGYSSRGTSGTGLGAVRRQSDEFDLYSTVEGGSVVMARIARGTKEATPPTGFSVDGISVPYPGEEVRGDAWRVRCQGDSASVMICDGLGHGVLASEASNAAADIFGASSSWAPADLLQQIHLGLRGSRGGAVAVGTFDRTTKKLSYGGIGNISGRLVSNEGPRGLVSANGTAGLQSGRQRVFDNDWLTGTLIMHSDGVQSRWNLSSYAGLLPRHPAVIAAVLYRDFKRGRDDISVVALKWNSNHAR